MEDFELHEDGVESLLFQLKADFLLVGVRRGWRMGMKGGIGIGRAPSWP
jgi:hypothetical protein